MVGPGTVCSWVSRAHTLTPALLALCRTTMTDAPGVQISDAGGLALAAALKRAQCLQRLNLNHNACSSITLAGLGEAIKPGTGVCAWGGGGKGKHMLSVHTSSSIRGLQGLARPDTVCVCAAQPAGGSSGVEELAVASRGSATEAGVTALLLAACGSKQLRLLDVRGVPLRNQVWQPWTFTAAGLHLGTPVPNCSLLCDAVGVSHNCRPSTR